MWRAFFLALGGIIMVTGVESLVLDHAVLADRTEQQAPQPIYDEWGFETGQTAPPAQKKIQPPEWAPWSMLSSGAVIMLYAMASKIRGE